MREEEYVDYCQAQQGYTYSEARASWEQLLLEVVQNHTPGILAVQQPLAHSFQTVPRETPSEPRHQHERRADGMSGRLLELDPHLRQKFFCCLGFAAPPSSTSF